MAPHINPDTLPPIASLVGCLNTEAKCVTFLATPESRQGATLASTTAALERLGAFSIQGGRDRFQVRQVVKSMGGTVLDTTLLDKPPEEEAKEHIPQLGKTPGFRTLIATALAGTYLHVSQQHSRPLRGALGEACISANGTHSVATRLAILEALYISHYSTRSSYRMFGRYEVKKATLGNLPISECTVDAHINRLIDAEVLQADGRHLIGFRPWAPGETSAVDFVSDILKGTYGVATGDTTRVSTGLAFAETLMNSHLVPVLIRRSFASTKHTGKETPRTVSS